jgi:hypothetical protein
VIKSHSWKQQKAVPNNNFPHLPCGSSAHTHSLLLLHML